MFEHGAVPFAAAQVEAVEHDLQYMPPEKSCPGWPGTVCNWAVQGRDVGAAQVEQVPLRDHVARHCGAAELGPALLGIDGQRVAEVGVAQVGGAPVELEKSVQVSVA